MRLVVVTGMSGGGKSTALNMLEDAGFYCVDNLPIPFLDEFIRKLPEDTEHENVALGLDARAGQTFVEASGILKKQKALGHKIEILFMDAGDEVLIKRYKETRRVHPLAGGDRVEEGIRREREILAGIRKEADYVIDSTHLLTRELKSQIDRIFVQNESYNSLMVTLLSFGYKYGIPADADLVFDVRFLPNPFYIDELKKKTGNDPEVRDYVMQFPESEEFLNKLTDMLEFLIPNYIKEGKYQLVVAIGCTGGQHRSVTLANALYERLNGRGGYGLKLYHREQKG